MKTYNKTSDSAFEIKKDDVFYYIYGLLHSDDYRDRFADNLSGNFRASHREEVRRFRSIARAGRELAHWHFGLRVGGLFTRPLSDWRWEQWP